jgi:glycosyltransferase involved in cell wall biosynthesis
MGWVDRQVVMYSGNHSLVHPLDDLLLGIQEEAEWRGVVFAFVGGGRGKLAAERLQAARDARDVVCLPYQPLETLSESLASADFHIVVMGSKMVGIVHPCKIYGALAIGRPILFFGPRDSAAGQLVARHQLGWIFEPGAAPSEVAAHLKEALASDASVREKMAARGRALMRSQFSPEELSQKFCDLIEDIAIKSS